MALTGLHTNDIGFIPTYKQDRDFLLKIAENDALAFGGSTGLTAA